MNCSVRRTQAAALFAFVSTIPAFAANRPQADEIVVTAARIEQSVPRVIGATTVITREDIQNRQVRSLHQLLRGETGLSVVNAGGLGKLTNVYVRGADAEQVLVLIDGVRAGSASSGTTAFEYLPVDQIERIEIVRGPRSSLYGSDAIGGVIQIFTRRADGFSINAGVGADSTFESSASLGLRSDSGWLSLAASRIDSDGYNSCTGAAFPPGGGCFTYEPDRDGYTNNAGSLRAGYRLGDRASIEASAMYAEGVNEYDGGFANETEFAVRALTLAGRVRPADFLTLQLTVGETRDLQDNFFADASVAPRIDAGAFDTVKRSASFQSDWSVAPAHLVSVGVDYVDDRVAGSTAYAATSRDNLGIFGQYEVRLGEHSLLVSARHDDNEQFGGHNTSSVGWKWSASEAFALTAAWGTAFGAPTFNDLYWPGFSNPDLDPEESQSYELGASGRAGAVNWSLTAFDSRIDEQIVYDVSISAPNNLNEARIRGLEAEASASFGAWTTAFSCTLLDPRNRTSGADFDNFLPRRARQLGHIEIGRTVGPLDARVRVTAEGSRHDDVANTERIGGYATVDLMLGYTINPAWAVQGKIANALDRDYQVLRYYEEEGRAVFVSVRYQPDF